MGFNGGNDIDIDKLTHVLEDHRDLLNDITNREMTKEGAATLPKLLFDLVTQSTEDQHQSFSAESVQEDDNLASEIETAIKPTVTSAQEIIHNLPKVWKVLIELLNHQKAEQVNFTVSVKSAIMMQLKVYHDFFRSFSGKWRKRRLLQFHSNAHWTTACTKRQQNVHKT